MKSLVIGSILHVERQITNEIIPKKETFAFIKKI